MAIVSVPSKKWTVLIPMPSRRPTMTYEPIAKSELEGSASSSGSSGWAAHVDVKQEGSTKRATPYELEEVEFEPPQHKPKRIKRWVAVKSDPYM